MEVRHNPKSILEGCQKGDCVKPFSSFESVEHRLICIICSRLSTSVQARKSPSGLNQIDSKCGLYIFRTSTEMLYYTTIDYTILYKNNLTIATVLVSDSNQRLCSSSIFKKKPPPQTFYGKKSNGVCLWPQVVLPKIQPSGSTYCYTHPALFVYFMHLNASFVHH